MNALISFQYVHSRDAAVTATASRHDGTHRIRSDRRDLVARLRHLGAHHTPLQSLHDHSAVDPSSTIPQRTQAIHRAPVLPRGHHADIPAPPRPGRHPTHTTPTSRGRPPGGQLSASPSAQPALANGGPCGLRRIGVRLASSRRGGRNSGDPSPAMRTSQRSLVG